MPIRERLAEMFGLRAAYEVGVESGEIIAAPMVVAPPQRPAAGRYVTPERALTLGEVFRGVQVHAVAVSQLSLDVFRWGTRMAETPAIVAKPDLEQSRSAFLEFVTVSLYLRGNAYLELVRSAFDNSVVEIKALNPAEVAVTRDEAGALVYTHNTRRIAGKNLIHLKFLRVPGSDYGLGPIQAAMAEFAGALDARDYGAGWFSDAAIPDAILRTDQELAPGDAEKYRNIWYGRNPDGSEKATPAGARGTERLRVLGKGLDYAPMLLKPAEVQFLETRKFNTTELARVLGLPASLLLAAIEGNSQTYANVEQDWIAYVRFSLMGVLREIEEAFTEILPRGQSARFNVEGLLRTDTKTRYEGHALALGRWMTADEIREIEGLPPLTDAQRATLAATPTTAPPPAPTRSLEEIHRA